MSEAYDPDVRNRCEHTEDEYVKEFKVGQNCWCHWCIVFIIGFI